MITEHPDTQTRFSGSASSSDCDSASPLIQWRPRCVIRATTQYTRDNPAGGCGPDDIHLILDGGDLPTLEVLMGVIGERLSLPAFTTRTPAAFANTLDRHLFVLAKADQYLQISVSRPELMSEAVMTSLLNWVKRMPLRLLLIGEEPDSDNSIQLMRALGIELLDLDSSDSSEVDVTEDDSLDAYVSALQIEAEAEEQLDGQLQEDLQEDLQEELPLEAAGASKNFWPYLLASVALVAATFAWFTLTTEPEIPAPITAEPVGQTIDPAVDPEPELKLQPEPAADAETVSVVDEASVARPAIAASVLTPEPEPARIPEPTPESTQTAQPKQTEAPQVTPTPLPESGYTIQIASYLSEELRDEYLENSKGLSLELRAAESKSGGRFKNLVVSGAYADYTAAARAIEELPPALQKSQPFPIKVSGLKP